MTNISRRDFLKLASVFTAGALGHSMLNVGNQSDRSNIIIILFDALSAKNMSLYGYARETTPNMSRFAERATVYHNYYSAGNFTIPGTASMLTGMLPWTHRAFNQGGLIKRDLIPNNMFSLLGSEYYRLMFSQNIWPDRLVSQAYEDVDRFLPPTAYSLRGNKLFSDKVGKDRYLASIAFEDFLFTLNSDVMGSSLLGYFYKSIAVESILKTRDHPWYPRGVPEVEGFTPYINEYVYEGVYRELQKLDANKAPYFSYFHLFSPHSPYKPGRKYWKLFEDDGFQILPKPLHPFGSKLSDDTLLSKRLLYDQQIAHVDAELGVLLDKLDADGILDNSYIILTSDHGELFERGFFGHGGVLLYEPVIKIPLLISAPGQINRQDIYTPSSNTDLLPTLLSIAGKLIPDVLDGEILSGFGGDDAKERALFSMYSVENPANRPLTKAAIAMHKGVYKLIAYYGYPGYDDVYEFYNLEDDPEELHNLSSENATTFTRLKEELLDTLADANRPFE